jgi:iron complex outermembrane receptor protein/vitamin B12 transporter
MQINPRTCILAILLAIAARPASAQSSGTASGTVIDPLGARVPGATVALLQEARIVTQTTTSGDGAFSLTVPAAGRYRLQAQAKGFDVATSEPFYAGAGSRVGVDLALSLGALQQDVLVTPAAADLPASQTGAQVTVLDAATLDALGKVDVLEALRLVPGAQIIQNGQRGATTSLFVRGGDSDFNTVLVDGVPANDIGGGFDWSTVSTAGIERVEVLREANSVLHGADSMTGVVSLATRRGRTRVPELSYAIDGGNLGTLRNDVAAGGASGRFDYFSEYAYFTTDNDLPNNEYTNGTYAGRFSMAIGRRTDLSGTIRRTDTRYGSPSAFGFYAIADDSALDTDFTAVGVTARSILTNRLRSTVMVSSLHYDSSFENPTPTGVPFDPFGFGANYLGQTVTITGANGYSTTGQAILDYGGTYPSRSLVHTVRNVVAGDATYEALPALAFSVGGRFEQENGYTQVNANRRSESDRNNGGVFGEGRVSAGRLHLTGGIGIEHNAVFGNAVSPRASVAAYLHDGSASPTFGGTKLILNVGRGIKAPAIFQELSSLYALLPPDQANRLGLEPIGPEKAVTFDVGAEQVLWRGQLVVRASYFRNAFSDLIEYVDSDVLPQLGIPEDAAEASGFGASVNAQSLDAQGLELSIDARVGGVRTAASYTFLDAEVTESFSSDALSPVFNPTIPGVEIGAYGPLIGARPFRRPRNAASLLVSYARGPAQVTFAGSFVGKRDDSTFLSDGFFGYTMLLPNHDLADRYQKVDISASYRVVARLRWFATIENLFDDDYEAAAGYPALPRTFRTGVTVMLGGGTAAP